MRKEAVKADWAQDCRETLNKLGGTDWAWSSLDGMNLTDLKHLEDFLDTVRRWVRAFRTSGAPLTVKEDELAAMLWRDLMRVLREHKEVVVRLIEEKK